jgi:hypothetical protein
MKPEAVHLHCSCSGGVDLPSAVLVAPLHVRRHLPPLLPHQLLDLARRQLRVRLPQLLPRLGAEDVVGGDLLRRVLVALDLLHHRQGVRLRLPRQHLRPTQAARWSVQRSRRGRWCNTNFALHSGWPVANVGVERGAWCQPPARNSSFETGGRGSMAAHDGRGLLSGA